MDEVEANAFLVVANLLRAMARQHDVLEATPNGRNEVFKIASESSVEKFRRFVNDNYRDVREC